MENKTIRFLILTQYFPPEVGAPQNRLFELAVRLQKMGVDVTILTAMPNYPQMQVHAAYRGKLYFHENLDGLNIHRSYIYVKNSKGIIPRLINYFSFVFSSLFVGLLKLDKYDFVFCESPPLFLGITAYLLNKLRGNKLIFNVSDLWPESAEKLGLVKNKILLNLSTSLEEFLYRKSAFISGQTQGIVKNISSRFPNKEVYWLKNGVDLSYYKYTHNSSWRNENGFEEDDFLLAYAGIVGHAQGLEVILNAAFLLKEYKKIKFLIIGSGPEKEGLIVLKEQLKLENVFFVGSQPKNKMPDITAAIDVSVIPLKRLDLFLGAIPSKIFENLAMKKPIILGVDGEAKHLFIDEGNCGLFFTPENHTELSQATLELFLNPETRKQLGENGFEYVKANFTRDAITESFYQLLLKNA